MKTNVYRLTAAVCMLFCIFPSLFAQQVTPLAANGRLKLVNRQLCNESGTPIQLRGMSSHGLHWFPACYTQSSIQALARDWGIDVFRAAMYVDEGGYRPDSVNLRAKVNQLVDWCAQAGIYCIIDWHILNPGDPFVHLDEAKNFFRLMAQQHAGKKNVIYEIANEPHDVDWARIKSYAEQIIPIIRSYDAQNIILVGTPNYSGTPGDVRGNPLTGANAYNVMYTFHFYAGSHYTQNYIDDVLKTVPLFISEWGVSNYSGNGGDDYNNSQAWLNLLAGGNSSGLKVSWTNWNYADKSETSSALQPNACSTGSWNNTSTSGTWVKDHILNPADNFGPPGTPGNQAPQVSISSPTNNATYTAPASVSISAGASDPDGSITRVQFYNGTNLLATFTAPPFQYSWSNVAAGTYTITAKATDNANTTSTSASVTIAVNASNPNPPPGGDISGPDCAGKNDVKVFQVSAANQANATNYSWWFNGYTQSIASSGARATFNFGPYFTGGQVCVGVNYAVAPYYRQLCKTVSVCSGTATAGWTPATAQQEVASSQVYPSLSSSSFTLAADKNILQVEVIDHWGRQYERMGRQPMGQRTRFGQQLAAGMYLVQIRYEDKSMRIVKIVKAD
ncbi:MAG: cellulase family glycosylhydrolase [Williamsia sp.]|nr:cellulase family glycosylhydrolase [Williamsia sp.]